MIKLTTLENGLRIISHHMSSVESVSFAVYNKVGSRDESKDINGTAHFLEHMAFKGTTTRSATEIVETIDRVGGSINAATGKDITKYTVDLLAEDLNIGVDIITDILQNSTFKTKEFEKERSVILEEISMNNDNPSRMIVNQWFKTSFPNQSVGRLTIGTKEIIKSIERNKIIDFMHNYYHPKKMIFTAAGKVNHDEFVDMINKSISNLPDGKINKKTAIESLDKLGIDNFGLDEMDRLILNTLIERFDGGPVGVNSLSVAVSEDPTTIEDVYEPYLIKQGFIQRTSRGRIANQRAFDLLGKKITDKQQRLFK